MKKIITIGLVSMLLILSLAACGNSQKPAASTDSTPAADTADLAADATNSEAPAATSDLVVDLSDITIGACVMSFQHEFMANLIVGYDEFVRQTNANVIKTDGGNMESEKQVTNVENYIQQGVDGILIQAVAVDPLLDTIKRALDGGTPVGLYPWDTRANATTYFGYNEYNWGYSLGEDAAKWAKDKLDGKAKVVYASSAREPQAIERGQGMREALEKELGAENVDWKEVDAKDATTAISNVESFLQAHPDTKFVFAFSDDVGVGAYEGVVQSGLDTSDMYLGSCDGTDKCLDYVAQDTVYRCTVANDRYVSEIGFYWCENMTKIILGMEYDNPFPITTLPVTIDNVEAYRTRQPKYEISQELIDFVNNKNK